MNKKILFCIDSPGFGGSEVNALKLIGELKSHFDVELLLNPEHSKELESFAIKNGLRIRHYFAPTNFVHFCNGIWQGLKVARSAKVDIFIIWSHHLNSNRWLQFVLALTRKKFVVVEQLLPTDYYGYLKKSRLTLPIKRFIAKRASATVICAFSQLKSYNLYFRPGNTTVIPNARDIKNISEAAARIKSLKESDRSLFTIICVGRLTEQKDQATLLTAVSLLANDFRLRVQLAGEGEDRKDLEKLIRELNVNASISGFVSDIIPDLARADIFVLPSKYEGLPGALLEAMAAGIPCIASDIPGNNELVIDQRTGLTFQTQSASGLSEAIRVLISDTRKAKELAKNAYQHVLANYDQAIEFEKWHQLLDSLGGSNN